MNRCIVYVVDDNRDFRRSLCWLLEGLGYGVSEHDDPAQALEKLIEIKITQQACLLLDIRMPTISGLELHDELRKSGIDIPVIYITGHADVPLAVAAMQKGAISFLEKPLKDDQLQRALELALSPAVQCQRLSVDDHAQAAERLEQLNLLSHRESEVLQGIVEGLSGRQIAEQLSVSVKTIEFHRGRLFKRLKADNIAQLQRIVATAGVAL